MARCRSLPMLGAAAGLFTLAQMPAATAGCGGWGCQPGCGFGPPIVYAPVVPCAAPLLPLQPVYRVEQGPIHNIVVVPYEEPRLQLGYAPRFFADCACYR